MPFFDKIFKDHCPAHNQKEEYRKVFTGNLQLGDGGASLSGHNKLCLFNRVTNALSIMGYILKTKHMKEYRSPLVLKAHISPEVTMP
mmetsp:Transcript_34244/g.70021  ORF Transcript_34244/g.70021 Transcript_34244/m.70021 type:complete len:87 (-) Transcript_34244:819-1079(-)